jgi:hypothetical protein
MDGSSLIVVVMPIMTLITLFTGIALPFVAATRSSRSPARRPPKPGADDAAPPDFCTSPVPASATTATRPRRAAGSSRCRSSRRRQS